MSDDTRASPYVLSTSWATAGGEDETPYGVSFPAAAEITLQVAPGAGLTDVSITDNLPATFYYESYSSSFTAGMTVTSSPAAGANSGTLQLDWASVPAGATFTVTVDGYFPHKTAGGPVLTPPGSVSVQNAATSSGTVLDGSAPTIVNQGDSATIFVRAMTVDKTVAPSIEPLVHGQNPPHTLTHTVTVRVADAHDFSVTGVTPVVSDTFNDGQDVDPTFNANTGMEIVRGVLSGTPSSFTTTVQGDGSTRVEVNLNQAISVEQMTAGATLVLRYRTTLPEAFKEPGGGSIPNGAALTSAVTVFASGRDTLTSINETYSPATSTFTQDTGEALVTKSIENIFRPGIGMLSPGVELRVGDYVRFRIRLELPNGDARALVLTDHLPTPLFTNSNILGFGAVPPGAPAGTPGSFSPNAENTNHPPDNSGFASAYFQLSNLIGGANTLVLSVGNVDAPPGVVHVFDYSFWIPVDTVDFPVDTTQQNFFSGYFNDADGDADSTPVAAVSALVLAPEDCVFEVSGCDDCAPENYDGTAQCQSDSDVGAMCIDQPSPAMGYTCDCSIGFVEDTGVCLNLDDCTPNPCQNGGTCTDGANEYSCSCAGGYTGDDCETDIDECVAANDCDFNATCTDSAVPGAPPQCVCPAGYTSTDAGRTCVNVDECLTAANDCDPNATCTDAAVPGAAPVCACNAGYSGTGRSCIPATGPGDAGVLDGGMDDGGRRDGGLSGDGGDSIDAGNEAPADAGAIDEDGGPADAGDGEPDAGSPGSADGGVPADAGEGEPDSGPPDGGVGKPDAGSPGSPDGGSDDDGCQCTANTTPGNSWPGTMALFGLVLVAGRRRGGARR